MGELITLNSLVSEIKFFENQAVVSYWEIGKRLSQAKEQVEHGNWLNWVQENLGYSEKTTERLILIYKEYSNPTLMSNLNFTQALALTSVDEETREKIIEKENLEDKTVRETKEIINKYKRENEELKEKYNKEKKDNEWYKNSNEHLKNSYEKIRDKYTEELSKEPKVVEKEVIKEVVPSDYENIKRENKLLQDKNAELELKYKVSTLNDKEEDQKLKSELRSYKWLVINFVKDATPMLNLVDHIKLLPKMEQDLLFKSTENLLGFTTNLYDQLKGVQNDRN